MGKWTRPMVMGSLVVLVALGLAAGVQATSKRVPLMADPKWETAGKASGEVLINQQGDRAELTLTANGLKAGSVYTIWFVNMMPKMEKAGVGQTPYAFTATQNGQGTYKARVSAAELRKWQVIFVVRHPDGDPRNMDRMEDALMGKLMP
ncbi:MAG: hypothetical protein HYY85_05280 [Deltaproteobacteria bacterium]|nr:hypothetical protein [Deltaproteobacteria bacterium]